MAELHLTQEEARQIAAAVVAELAPLFGSASPSRLAGERPLLDAKKVASMLDVKEKTVRTWTARGLVPCLRFEGGTVRYDPVEIEAWLRSHRTRRRTADEIATAFLGKNGARPSKASQDAARQNREV